MSSIIFLFPKCFFRGDIPSLLDERLEKTPTLPEPVMTGTVKLIINSVYPGEKWKDTVISDASLVAFYIHETDG